MNQHCAIVSGNPSYFPPALKRDLAAAIDRADSALAFVPAPAEAA
jgi:hypothetical protein